VHLHCAGSASEAMKQSDKGNLGSRQQRCIIELMLQQNYCCAKLCSTMSPSKKQNYKKRLQAENEACVLLEG